MRWSRAGLAVAGGFLALAGAVLGFVMWSAGNPADSGESGVLLLPFAWPWYRLVPSSWLGLPAGLGMIGLNALLLFLLFGGLRGGARRG